MSKKNISREKIIQAFLVAAFERSAGATSLSDVADTLEIKKASLYNHFQNKEEMYVSTLEYCESEINSVAEYSTNIIKAINSGKVSPSGYFKKYINRYFDLYETEPLFQIYVFITTEQFFNVTALNIFQKEKERLIKEIHLILKTFAKQEKLVSKSEKETSMYAQIIASVILENLSAYIAQRKEIVRQNPECDAGSLFALPADDAAINNVIKVVDTILKELSND